jgi:hypothetical protein
MDDRVPGLADMPLLERWLQRVENGNPCAGAAR